MWHRMKSRKRRWWLLLPHAPRALKTLRQASSSKFDVQIASGVNAALYFFDTAVEM